MTLLNTKDCGSVDMEEFIRPDVISKMCEEVTGLPACENDGPFRTPRPHIRSLVT